MGTGDFVDDKSLSDKELLKQAVKSVLKEAIVELLCEILDFLIKKKKGNKGS